jgi:hypothetical protein
MSRHTLKKLNIFKIVIISVIKDQIKRVKLLNNLRFYYFLHSSFDFIGKGILTMKQEIEVTDVQFETDSTKEDENDATFTKLAFFSTNQGLFALSRDIKFVANSGLR